MNETIKTFAIRNKAIGINTRKQLFFKKAVISKPAVK